LRHWEEVAVADVSFMRDQDAEGSPERRERLAVKSHVARRFEWGGAEGQSASSMERMVLQTST
jgi:hypothetical protein